MTLSNCAQSTTALSCTTTSFFPEAAHYLMGSTNASNADSSRELTRGWHSITRLQERTQRSSAMFSKISCKGTLFGSEVLYWAPKRTSQTSATLVRITWRKVPASVVTMQSSIVE